MHGHGEQENVQTDKQHRALVCVSAAQCRFFTFFLGHFFVFIFVFSPARSCSAVHKMWHQPRNFDIRLRKPQRGYHSTPISLRGAIIQHPYHSTPISLNTHVAATRASPKGRLRRWQHSRKEILQAPTDQSCDQIVFIYAQCQGA